MISSAHLLLPKMNSSSDNYLLFSSDMYPWSSTPNTSVEVLVTVKYGGFGIARSNLIVYQSNGYLYAQRPALNI